MHVALSFISVIVLLCGVSVAIDSRHCQSKMGQLTAALAIILVGLGMLMIVLITIKN